MIISEKQIMQLMQFSQSYVIALDTLYQFDKTLLSECGLHNKTVVANLLMQITNQQSEKLKGITPIVVTIGLIENNIDLYRLFYL